MFSVASNTRDRPWKNIFKSTFVTSMQSLEKKVFFFHPTVLRTHYAMLGRHYLRAGKLFIVIILYSINDCKIKLQQASCGKERNQHKKRSENHKKQSEIAFLLQCIKQNAFRSENMCNVNNFPTSKNKIFWKQPIFICRYMVATLFCFMEKYIPETGTILPLFFSFTRIVLTYNAQ